MAALAFVIGLVGGFFCGICGTKRRIKQHSPPSNNPPSSSPSSTPLYDDIIPMRKESEEIVLNENIVYGQIQA